MCWGLERPLGQAQGAEGESGRPVWCVPQERGQQVHTKAQEGRNSRAGLRKKVLPGSIMRARHCTHWPWAPQRQGHVSR